ncbi:dNTP triphosphohydrolase [Candidatus Peregrinibacteria bacterium]|nr:dNTP triphosphohydrolase [Candidatus Peregrinibacteria bacterium]
MRDKEITFAGCTQGYNKPMKPLSLRIQEANSVLAAHAVPIQGTLGRVEPEPEDDTRFPFQRDRDRIIHTQAFRRLQGKTQVFVAGEGDHYRTRLTHTMEVAQLSRDMARTLSLNEDLAECIALSHDLGHPPFAHMGEQALDAWMKKYGSGFEHNEQSLRAVTLLEEHSTMHHGLNVNREVLEGLKKHPGQRSADGLKPALEAQIVNIADEIAYSAHDCDDGIRAGLFAATDLCAVPLAKEALHLSGERKTSMRGALINLLMNDLYAATDAELASQGIRALDDVYSALRPIVKFSDGMIASLRTLHDFLNERMYANARVLEAGRQGQEIVTALCDKFYARPIAKVLELQKRIGDSLHEAVKDYVAGMTDAYARSMR